MNIICYIIHDVYIKLTVITMNISLIYFKNADIIKKMSDKILEIFLLIGIYDQDDTNNIINITEYYHDEFYKSLLISCLITYYINLIELPDNKILSKLSEIVLHINNKILLLSLNNDDNIEFWICIIKRIINNVNLINENIILNNNLSDYSIKELVVEYDKFNNFQNQLLNINKTINMIDIISDQITKPYYDCINYKVKNKINEINDNLNSIYNCYQYDSTNGILNSYYQLQVSVHCIIDIINSVNILNITNYLYEDIAHSYIKYSNIIKFNNTFVKNNIEILTSLNITILTIINDVKLFEINNSIFFKEVTDIYEHLKSYVSGNIIIYYENKIKDILKNKIGDIDTDHFHNDDIAMLSEMLNKIYNNNIQIACENTNFMIFDNICNKLIVELLNIIVNYGVNLFKSDNTNKINRNIQILKGTISNIIEDKYKHINCINYIIDLFAPIVLIIEYILNKYIVKNGEKIYKNKFKKMFSSCDIYNSIYVAKIQQKSLSTKITDNSSLFIKSNGKIVGETSSKLFKSSTKVANIISESVNSTFDGFAKFNLFDSEKT